MGEIDQISSTLGNHGAQLESLKREMSAINTKLDEAMRDSNEKLDRVLAVTERARGSWRTLVAIGGITTAVIEGIHQLVSWVHGT